MSIDILKYLKGTRNSFYCNELNGIFYIIDDESSVNYYDCTTFKAYIVYKKKSKNHFISNFGICGNVLYVSEYVKRSSKEIKRFIHMMAMKNNILGRIHCNSIIKHLIPNSSSISCFRNFGNELFGRFFSFNHDKYILLSDKKYEIINQNFDYEKNPFSDGI